MSELMNEGTLAERADSAGSHNLDSSAPASVSLPLLETEAAFHTSFQTHPPGSSGA